MKKTFIIFDCLEFEFYFKQINIIMHDESPILDEGK